MADLQSEPSASEQPNIPAPSGAGDDSDSFARKELASLNSKSEGPTNWNEWAKNNQIKRDEFLRHCFFYAVSILILLAAALLGFAMIVWVWHLIGPPWGRWLSNAEIEKLQVFVFSGAVSSLATVIGKRILNATDQGK